MELTNLQKKTIQLIELAKEIHSLTLNNSEDLENDIELADLISSQVLTFTNELVS